MVCYIQCVCAGVSFGAFNGVREFVGGSGALPQSGKMKKVKNGPTSK